MYLLGLSGYSHEAACALVKDGEIRAIVEEERLNREKHTWRFPVNAIRACLDMEGITIEDVDKITFFWRPADEIIDNARHFFRYLPGTLHLLLARSGGSDMRPLGRLWSIARAGDAIRREFGLARSPKVEFIDHHLCHAASAFFGSGFDEAAILILDGRGEADSGSTFLGRGNRLQKLQAVRGPHSLGFMYAAFTDYLGFTPLFDEWKVMGMSAYGHPRYCADFEDLLELLPDGGYRLNFDYFSFQTHGYSRWISDRMIGRFGPPRASDGEYTQHHFDIAYALQHTIENAGVHVASHLYEKTRSPNLCLAGGVALNVLMNKAIMERTPFENVFIQPIAHDAGTALGSALYYYHSVLGNECRNTFDHVYWGPEFSEERIEQALSLRGLAYRRSDDIAAETAPHIAAGKIVGWFQGRMEAGPRALGNRSITVSPLEVEMKDRLNARVKKREFFRPFAPSVLEEKADEYFVLPKGVSSPFMAMVGDVRPEKRAVIPAVTHADNTARVQTVSRAVNPRYWRLIREFESLTGVPVLLNTSFNENEPIVCSPEEAVDCFQRTDFDVLAIGDFLVERQDKGYSE